MNLLVDLALSGTHNQSCANTASFTNGTVIYGVIWTPYTVFSYDLRRSSQFFTVIYGLYCKTS